jgi:hypothetical protein
VKTVPVEEPAETEQKAAAKELQGGIKRPA